MSADNITGGETDSDDGPAEVGPNFGDDRLAPDGELANGETVRVSVSGDLACGDEVENHLRVAGIGTGTASDRGPPSTLASSDLGGVGGMTFITGGCEVSKIGGPFRAKSTGGDGSSAGCGLLARLEEDEDEGANQARFLGISLVSVSG